MYPLPPLRCVPQGCLRLGRVLAALRTRPCLVCLAPAMQASPTTIGPLESCMVLLMGRGMPAHAMKRTQDWRKGREFAYAKLT